MASERVIKDGVLLCWLLLLVSAQCEHSCLQGAKEQTLMGPEESSPVSAMTQLQSHLGQVCHTPWPPIFPVMCSIQIPLWTPLYPLVWLADPMSSAFQWLLHSTKFDGGPGRAL